MNKRTNISFYLKSGTVRIYRDTMRAIGKPMFVRLRLHSRIPSLIVEPFDRITLTSFRVPQKLFKDNGAMQIHSKALCEMIANEMKWESERSYTITGHPYAEQKIVLFDLTQAVEIRSPWEGEV